VKRTGHEGREALKKGQLLFAIYGRKNQGFLGHKSRGEEVPREGATFLVFWGGVSLKRDLGENESHQEAHDKRKRWGFEGGGKKRTRRKRRKSEAQREPGKGRLQRRVSEILFVKKGGRGKKKKGKTRRGDQTQGGGRRGPSSKLAFTNGTPQKKKNLVKKGGKKSRKVAARGINPFCKLQNLTYNGKELLAASTKKIGVRNGGEGGQSLSGRNA